MALFRWGSAMVGGKLYNSIYPNIHCTSWFDEFGEAAISGYRHKLMGNRHVGIGLGEGFRAAVPAVLPFMEWYIDPKCSQHRLRKSCIRTEWLLLMQNLVGLMFEDVQKISNKPANMTD